MTLPQLHVSSDRLLDALNDSIRMLREDGHEARYVLVGPEAYARLREAMAARFRRSEGTWETYQGLPIVLDPARGDALVVLPAPAALADGAALYDVHA